MTLTRIFFFLINHTATTSIYTLSYTTLFRSLVEDLLTLAQLESGNPNLQMGTVDLSSFLPEMVRDWEKKLTRKQLHIIVDRKSTRLNSSHITISYAVFCLKKKIKNQLTILT